MAVAIPGTFLASVQPMQAREETVKRYRLSSNHISDLRDVARGVEESNVGVACRYLVDHSIAGADHDIDEDGYINHLDAIERFCDQHSVWKHPAVVTWRSRIARCRHAFALMHGAGEHKAVSVLHIVYGYQDPLIRTFAKKVLDTLGELAPLARYTDIVEVRRQEMARIEAVRLDERANYEMTMQMLREEKYPEKFAPEAKSAVQEIVTASAKAEEQRATAIRHGLRANVGKHLMNVLRRREYHHWALASITSTDALRNHLQVPGEREWDETKEQFQERRDAAEAKRDLFIAQVKIEAEKMLSQASQKYYEAWLKAKYQGQR